MYMYEYKYKYKYKYNSTMTNLFAGRWWNLVVVLLTAAANNCDAFSAPKGSAAAPLDRKKASLTSRVHSCM
jgi:hypothetical protein